MGVLLGLTTGLGLLLVLIAVGAPQASHAPREARLGSTSELLARAGVHSLSPAAFVAISAASGSAAFVVLWAVSRTLPVALAFGVLATLLPRAVLSGRARRRQREFAEVWPEAVDNLASAVRAGMSLPEALGALSTRGPVPLRPAFEGFAVDYQFTGRFAESLDRLKERLSDPVGDRVVESLRIARDVGGGDLGRLLRNLSAFLRDDLRTRAELESRQAWTVYGARLAVAAPWLVLFMLSFQSEVISRYSSPGGVVVLAGGAACCLVAYRLMVRIGRLPRDERILG